MQNIKENCPRCDGKGYCERYDRGAPFSGPCNICHGSGLKTIDPHEKKIAYIAGALNDMSCDYIVNVRRMIVWGEKLNDLNFSVFVPGLDLLWGIATGNLDYNRAFNNSQPFLAKADIMFVCPGWENSKGTKREIETATSLDVPVYYGDDGYKLLRIEFDQANDATTSNDASNDATMSDEESARDRRRSKGRYYTVAEDLDAEARKELDRRIAESQVRKSAWGPLVNSPQGNKSFPTSDSLPTVEELSDRARKELDKRIAESPFRKQVDKTCEQLCDESTKNIKQRIKDSVNESRKKIYMHMVEGPYDEHVVPNEVKPGEVKRDRFIEESNSEIYYLDDDTHPEYRLVSVIKEPRTTNEFGPSEQYSTYIWELKDV